jgi:hypothetical protein
MINRYKSDWKIISKNNNALSEYKKLWYNSRNRIKTAPCPICENMGEYKIRIDYDGLALCEFYADGFYVILRSEH